MRQALLVFSAACGLALSGSALAQSMPSMPEHHHHDAPAPGEKLGQVSFPTSCSAKSQAEMERGIALLHSFGYTNAQMQFEAIAKDDPACAMAHWGIAMAQFQELWQQPDEASLKRGAEEMKKARALAAKATPRERAYIGALNAFYDPAARSYESRANAYATKMNALHAAFPEDVEGAAFDALALLASEVPGDSSLTHEHQALAILTPLFAAHPDHPGLAHYIIHTCDTPALARDGLAAAREYAKIAPSSAHALHMPGHIFARLGMWKEDIDSNLASVAASEKSAAAHEPGAAHQMHADEFLIYAWLQVGEDEKARELTLKMPSISSEMAAMPGMDDMKDTGPFFANELAAVYAMEMHDWKAAAALKPVAGSPPFETFHTYWAQGVAAGHLKDAKLAAAAVAGIEQNMEAVKGTPFVSLAGTSMRIKHGELLGWKAFAEGKPDEAVKAMRAAADEQDKLGQDEVDIPAREMLGDLLLLEHRPAEALVEYHVALKLSPNRLNGLLSAGNAAEQGMMPDEARSLYRAAILQAGANSRRPELAHAMTVTGITATAKAGN